MEESEEVVFIKALMSPDRYFIFRDRGIEVTINVLGDTILKPHTLTVIEEKAIQQELL